MCQKSCACPHCKSSETLVDYWTLFLTLEQWPSSLLAISTVTLVGNFLQLAPTQTFYFLLLSAIPTLFEVSRKKSCLECGIDFDTPIPAPVRTKRTNHYEQL